jgi:hypothetical protein
MTMPLQERQQLALKLYNVTLETLETIPSRALDFLRGTGRNLAVFASLQRRGYDKIIHQQGWDFLQATGRTALVSTGKEMDPKVAAAVAQADAMDGDLIKVVTAAWKVRFPEQLKFVLGQMKASTGMEAVLNCRTIVLGLQAMEDGAERASTRQQDAEALAILAKRGLGPSERKELASIVEIATSTPETRPPTPEQVAAEDEAYVRALGDLWVWYDEWSEIARVEVKRRDRLMLLGLAHRKFSGEDVEDPAPEGPPNG